MSLINYIAYNQPRVGLFRIEKANGMYSCEHGWEKQIVEHTIVGEDEHWYVVDADKPVGVHKSRFEKWIDHQLKLDI